MWGWNELLQRLKRRAQNSVAPISVLDIPGCDVRPAPHSASQHAECPRWDTVTGAAYWIDMPTGKLHRHAPDTGLHNSWSLAPQLSALVLDNVGRALIGIGNELHWFDPTSDELTLWRTVPLLDTARERFNDGGWAPDGSLWLATMALDGASRLGRMLRVSKTSVDIIADGITIGNGPAFDSQRNFAYFADSPARVVYRVALSDPARREEFVRTDASSGFPDGMIVDSGGSLWIAHYDGECLSRWSADGAQTGIVRLPGHCPTAIAQIPSTSGHFEAAVTTSTLGKSMTGGLLFLHISDSHA